MVESNRISFGFSSMQHLCLVSLIIEVSGIRLQSKRYSMIVTQSRKILGCKDLSDEGGSTLIVLWKLSFSITLGVGLE